MVEKFSQYVRQELSMPANFTSEEFNSLRRKFEKLNEETTFNEDPKLASLVTCIGIHREIGTANDELARLFLMPVPEKFCHFHR